MKKMMKYTLRAIVSIVAMTAFCVLVGEPTESLTRFQVILIKATAAVLIVGAYKVHSLTFTERERRELEDERV